MGGAINQPRGCDMTLGEVAVDHSFLAVVVSLNSSSNDNLVGMALHRVVPLHPISSSSKPPGNSHRASRFSDSSRFLLCSVLGELRLR